MLKCRLGKVRVHASRPCSIHRNGFSETPDFNDRLTMTTAIVIEPGRQELNYWRDLWHYRELFYVLAWRDVAVRYKQTVIGIAWAVILPLLTTVGFAIVFGHIAKLPSEGSAPYPLMVFAGML